MVIVHRRMAYRCPIGGRDAPTKYIEFAIEYLPKEKEFRINLPEHMHERLGETYAHGQTADGCEENMHRLWGKFQDTFTEPREIRKLIAYKQGNGGSYGLSSKSVSIRLDWDVVHVCQLNTDSPEETGWIRCTEEGEIRSTDAIRNRIIPDQISHSEYQYISWTPPREEFFKGVVEQFNNVSRQMTDFFERHKGLQTVIDRIDTARAVQLPFIQAKPDGDKDDGDTGKVVTNSGKTLTSKLISSSEGEDFVSFSLDELSHKDLCIFGFISELEQAEYVDIESFIIDEENGGA